MEAGLFQNRPKSYEIKIFDGLYVLEIVLFLYKFEVVIQKCTNIPNRNILNLLIYDGEDIRKAGDTEIINGRSVTKKK